MALLDEILAWSESDLPLWQRDAVKRLFQQTLDTAALDDLYAMLKDAAGLPDPAQRKPEPLAKHHLPVTAAAGASVKLIALRDVRNVNRLAPDQVMSFAEKGLTVVYGGNAAGKSGYARVLKHACRSRDASEDVRPNALVDPATHGVPQAKFDIELAGIKSEVSWKKETPPLPN